MTNFKKAVRKIHLWLGLASGLVVFIVAITGCLYVFQKEINESYYDEVFFIEKQNKATLPLSALLNNAQTALGGNKPVNFITCHGQGDRAWEFGAYKEGDKNALTYFGALAYYQVACVDPYTGKVTGVIDYKYNFFNIVKYLHWSLLLNTCYGQPIVGYATLLFVIMLITGMILWWPKKWNQTNRNNSLRIKWNATFKRLVYDLHKVPGFYAMSIALIISLTGMVWALDWFQKTVYVVATQSVTPPTYVATKSNGTAIKSISPLDIAFDHACSLFKEKDRIGVSLPGSKDGYYSIVGYRGKETYYNYDELRYDQYSGELLYRRNYGARTRGEQLTGMNYDIHVGAILGLPGKIMAFIGSLVAASLPVTGTLIWIGRKRKKKYLAVA